jgi:mannose-6-phosphate isomerase-like protein (cupin superfamily)
MQGFSTDIEKATLENDNFRKVLYTAKKSQLVLMSLKPKEDIGLETHPNDQFFRVESGEGVAVVDGNEHPLSSKTVVIVPAGCEHNVTNTSDTESLKLYTLYSPPHHKDGIVRATKEEAVADDPEFDGVTTE